MDRFDDETLRELSEGWVRSSDDTMELIQALAVEVIKLREGAKRARREAISEVRQRLIDLFWKPDGYFADWLLEQLRQGPLAAKEEEAP